MANINIKLNVDDKKLQEVLKKQYSVEVKPDVVQQKFTSKTVQQQMAQTATTAIQQKAAATAIEASALKSAVGAGVGVSTVQSLLSAGVGAGATQSLLSAGAGAYAGTRIGAVTSAKFTEDFTKQLKIASKTLPKITSLQSVLDFFEEQKRKKRPSFVEVSPKVSSLKSILNAPEILKNVESTSYVSSLKSILNAPEILKKEIKKNRPPNADSFSSLFAELPKIGQKLKNSMSSLTSFVNYATSLAKTFGSKVKDIANSIAEGVQKALVFLSSTVGAKLSTALSFLGKHWLGIAGTLSAILAPALAASTYIIRQRQQAFAASVPTAEAISGLFTNVNESLFSKYPEIVEKMQAVAKTTGISIEDLAKAVEESIPGLENQTPEVLQNRAEIYAKLRKLEHLQPEQFAEIANVADIAGEDLARISQMYNVLTDNVKTGTDQVIAQLRRLADDFGYDMPSLFATVEAVSKQLPDPRETTQVIREGLQDLKQYNDALSKYYAEVNDLMKEGLTQQEALQIATPPEMPGEKGQLLQQLFSTSNFAELYQKYAQIQSEDLTKSAQKLERLPSQQLVDFFAQQREEIKSGMYKYIEEKGLQGLEKTYAGINNLISKYFNEDLQPFVKPLFISPETGTPTFLSAVLTSLQPTFDVINGIYVSIETAVDIIKQFKSAFDYFASYFATPSLANKNANDAAKNLYTLFNVGG